MKSVALTPEALTGYDCVLIATHHKAYDWQMVADNAKLIVDTRNARQGRAREARPHREGMRWVSDGGEGVEVGEGVKDTPLSHLVTPARSSPLALVVRIRQRRRVDDRHILLLLSTAHASRASSPE